MRSRTLGIMLAIQAVLSYLCWPNPLLPHPNLLSAALIFIMPIPFYWIFLSGRGLRTVMFAGLSGVAMALPGVAYFTDMTFFPVARWAILLLIATIIFVSGSLAAWAADRILKSFPGTFLLTVPMVYSGLEFFACTLSSRVWFVPPPQSLFAYPLAGFTPLIQMASFTGVYGVMYLVWFASAGLAVLGWQWLLQRPPEKRPAWLEPQWQPLAPGLLPAVRNTAWVIGLILAGLTVAGNLEAIQVAAEQKTCQSVLTPALLQAQFDPARFRRWDIAAQYACLDAYRLMALEAVRQKAELLVFPEGGMPAKLPGDRLRFWRVFCGLLAEVNMDGLIGLITTTSSHAAANAWYQVGPNGKIKSFYLKNSLLPIGEYLPMRPLVNAVAAGINGLFRTRLRFMKLTAINIMDNDLVPGQEDQVFDLNGKKFILRVCQEIHFPDAVRRGVRLGGNAILSSAGGGWFDHLDYFWAFTIISQFRAVENRRWVARLVNMEGSVFIDALGNIRSLSPTQKRFVHVYPMPLLTRITVYTRFGDWFGWICLLIPVALLGLSFIRRK